MPTLSKRRELRASTFLSIINVCCNLNKTRTHLITSPKTAAVHLISSGRDTGNWPRHGAGKTFHSPWAKRLASSIVKQGACIVSEYVVGHAWRHAMAMLFVDCLLALWKHGWKGHKAWLSVASATARLVGHRCFLASGGSRPRLQAESATRQSLPNSRTRSTTCSRGPILRRTLPLVLQLNIRTT